jgi:energy-coupling factor transporter ATP-binding protein EcfA2|uniref:DNA mismatch repair proteins mutS family domain-containing protein n=1 Tax=viral metagenome TaxID=1070528 RepID=A0A6C0H3S7_9ZZZZ
MDFINKLMNFYEDTNLNSKQQYADCFKLPIEYLDTSSIQILSTNIINDLELVKTKPALMDDYNNSSNTNTNTNSNTNTNTNSNNCEKQTSIICPATNDEYNLYYHVFNPTNIFEKNIICRWSKYYTNNVDFLLETQVLLKNYSAFKKVEFSETKTTIQEDSIYNKCESIIYDNGFINNYQYIDIPLLSNFNNNSVCLQLLSMYNLSSPVFSLLIPILFLLLPFFLIKLQGHNITFALYFDHLKKVFSNHIIGQLFSSFSSTNFTNKIYLLFSFGFYIFQMYLNFTSCIKYFTNIKFIHETLNDLKNYIVSCLNKFKNFLKYSKDLTNYKSFNDTINKNISIFTYYLEELNNITPYTLSINKLTELGQLMKCFYCLNKDENIINSLYFSFGFNGYLKNLETLQNFINTKVMNYCTYDNSKPTSFDGAYFANLNIIEKHQDTCETKGYGSECQEICDKETCEKLKANDKNKHKIVKNSYSLKKNIIITGPNASGKTTLLKSTLFNIILSQQIGCGFFNSASVKIYDYIHCYINIPDTGGRDSLYQAEARQCKNILEAIENNATKNHFCVFDELYSGTNPEEAIDSAYGYLTYLNKFNNIDYVLTTHYTKLCKKLNKQNNNLYMKVNTNSKDFEYTYKIKKGISKVKGALKVLKDLNYPENIITNMKN